MKRTTAHILILLTLIAFIACYEEEKLNVPMEEVTPSTDTIDQYIQENFIDRYGVAVRYKFVDRYVDQTKRVSPPSREVVIPMLEFLNEFWIDPYISVPNGGQFFRTHVPAEVVFIGSSIFNEDGTITLGTADAGARITLTEVNDIDIANQDWVFRQLGTIYHEFAHIVHQRYNLPSNFQQISPDGYTSAGSWYNLSEEEALQRGFVSPYGTSSFNEDFAETVAFFLYDPDFYDNYINDETNCLDAECEARNEGRAKIRTKYNAIVAHYKQVTGVDLLLVREIIQNKLN
ncbi:MAG: putative zinc-binding metallopeptidase [Flammeovirgaceae bacterium]|nr:putative zinc-binding metallopeptidase [Flammeovirgaceae bacterium]